MSKVSSKGSEQNFNIFSTTQLIIVCVQCQKSRTKPQYMFVLGCEECHCTVFTFFLVYLQYFAAQGQWISILSGPRGGTICTTSMGKNCSYLKYKNWKWCVYPALLLQTITDASRRRKYSPQHLVLWYTILTQHNKPLGGKLQHWLCSGLLLKALPLSPKGSLL